jgi:hypothetical protein
MKTVLVPEDESLKKKIVEWGCQHLTSLGYTLNNNLPETVQNTPWSYVVRFATSDGYIYLKNTPALLALEAPITQILHDEFHAAVPKVIAHNAELNCFLMKDAGNSLRGILKIEFNATLLRKAIEQFTSTQVAVADHVQVFLDLGVPDWRLDKLSGLFQQLLSQTDILIADGLSSTEINELEKQFSKVSNLCKHLSNYSIKQTIVQCDFHDNNIVVDDAMRVTCIDLGEIVISHPFFSLIGCLRQVQTHHGLTEYEAHLQLMDAGLKNFLPMESKKHLEEAFMLAKTLWFIYESLGQYRLMIACDKVKFTSFQRHGKLSGQLKEFMKACITMD